MSDKELRTEVEALRRRLQRLGGDAVTSVQAHEIVEAELRALRDRLAQPLEDRCLGRDADGKEADARDD